MISKWRSTSVRSVPEPSIRSPSRTLRTACSGVCRLLFIVVILPSLGIQTHNTRTQIRIPPHVAIGVNLAGERDVLGLWLGPTGGEGAKGWVTMLTELRNRGLTDALTVCCDGLRGLPDATRATRPQEPARVGSLLSPISASNSDAGHLEWLLIVAAVAGLAALGVVIVQNVVSDTAEQISNSSARFTAAQVAAQAVEREAKNVEDQDVSAAGGRFNSWQKWENYFTDKCTRISITYSDALIDVTAAFDDNGATLSAAAMRVAEREPSSGTAQAKCEVSRR